jgi:uncharacterized protein (DUF2235 family)
VAGLLNKCGLLDQYNDNLVPYALRIYLQKGNNKIASEFKRTMARECVPEMLGVWDTVKSLGSNHEEDFFYKGERPNSRHGYHALSIDERREDFVPSKWGDAQDENHIDVWFPGAHSDVGGGYAEDGLANGALQWMIARAREHNVAFREDRVAEFDSDPTDLLHDSRAGLWNLRDAVEREVPQGARVHRSALDRREAVADYDPENLPSDLEPVAN